MKQADIKSENFKSRKNLSYHYKLKNNTMVKYNFYEDELKEYRVIQYKRGLLVGILLGTLITSILWKILA